MFYYDTKGTHSICQLITPVWFMPRDSFKLNIAFCSIHYCLYSLSPPSYLSLSSDITSVKIQSWAVVVCLAVMFVVDCVRPGWSGKDQRVLPE